MIDDYQPCELPSNDGWTRVLFDINPVPLAGHPGLRAGSLRVTRCYWDRARLLDGDHSEHLPDFVLELRQVLFNVDCLRMLLSALLTWTTMPFEDLPRAKLELSVGLCSDRNLKLGLELGPVHSHGDRATCILTVRTGALEDQQIGSCAFTIDLTGAHRFATEVQERLGLLE